MNPMVNFEKKPRLKDLVDAYANDMAPLLEAKDLSGIEKQILRTALKNLVNGYAAQTNSEIDKLNISYEERKKLQVTVQKNNAVLVAYIDTLWP
jgi:hypothetical protein